jgi:anti-sigma-K factor RskA
VQHCTPEQLALAALREPLPADDAAHLGSCDSCRAEVASLQRAVDLLSVPQLAAPGAPMPPPPRVWEAIAAATGTSAPPAGATVLPFHRRHRLLLVAAAAVAVGAVVGAGAVALVQSRDDGRAVEAVALDPLAGNDASGQASVVVQDDGRRVLEVDLDAPQLSDSYYEIWLIDRSVEGMYPLGVVQPGKQTVEVPADLDLAEFPLVDVSVEPMDGNPTHSGVSVVRGELES